MEYQIIWTNTADKQLSSRIVYIALNFGKKVANERLLDIEKNILLLENNPLLGSIPKDLTLKKMGFRVLILEKNIVLYQVLEETKEVLICLFVDHRQDTINIINGL